MLQYFSARAFRDQQSIAQHDDIIDERQISSDIPVCVQVHVEVALKVRKALLKNRMPFEIVMISAAFCPDSLYMPIREYGLTCVHIEARYLLADMIALLNI